MPRTGVTDGRQLPDRVNGGELRRLRHTHDPRLGEVDVAAALDGPVDGVGPELGTLPLEEQELRAVGEKLRRAALVGLDVRHFVAEDRVVRLAHRGQGQRIGGGTVEAEKDLGVVLEDLANQLAGPRRPLVVAIARHRPDIRLLETGPRLGAVAGGVVTGELATGRDGGWHRFSPARRPGPPPRHRSADLGRR